MSIEFGSRGKKFGVLTFYDIITDNTYHKMEMVFANIPEEVQCSENKMFSFYFEFGEYTHIREIGILMDKLFDLFEKIGWIIYSNNDAIHCVSQIHNLESSKDSKFINTKYEEYDLEPNIREDLNIALGFTIIMKKNESSPITDNEKEEIKTIITENINF